jgi:hypothetical protein
VAHTDPLPQSALTQVARQVGQFLIRPATAAAALTVPSAPELAESLAICFAGADQVADPPADLSVLAQPSGLWHHQIRTAAGPTLSAWSRQAGFDPATLDVQQVVESPVAARLDQAMAWVDRAVPDNAVTARLLVIPAYYVHALLLIRGKKLTAVLVDQPAGFTALKYQKEYPLREFLKRLSKEQPGATLT